MKLKNTLSFQSVEGKKDSNLIRRYIIIGERRISNYWWASIIFVGALGFLFTGISSYFSLNLTELIDPTSTITNFTSNSTFGSEGLTGLVSAPSLPGEKLATKISFFPQGLLMSFYGSLGLLLSLYWWLLIFWNVGGGFNEFNKQDGFIRVFRWGYPGNMRRIDLSYPLKDVEAIRVELKQGFDPQRTIYIRFKGKPEIPLTGIGEPLTLKEIEKQASELANFLQVSLEGL